MTGSPKSKRFNDLSHYFPLRIERAKVAHQVHNAAIISRLQFKSVALFSYSAWRNSAKAELTISRRRFKRRQSTEEHMALGGAGEEGASDGRTTC